jgi:hypothetical protein
MSHWVDTYPHEIYASVLLLDNKIEGWKVGQRYWTFPQEAKAYWKMHRINDYTSHWQLWTVNNSDEHNRVFSELSTEWYRQWELADDFQLFPPYDAKTDLPY